MILWQGCEEKKLSEMSNCDTKFKLMMLGDAGVGKTSIARRFVDQVEAHGALSWLVKGLFVIETAGKLRNVAASR